MKRFHLVAKHLVIPFALLGAAACDNSPKPADGENSVTTASKASTLSEKEPPDRVTNASSRRSYDSFRLTDAEFERRLRPEYAKCMDGSEGVTINIRACSEAEGEVQDRELNAVYKTTMSRLPGATERSELRTSQRSWLSSRYGHCDEELARAGEGGEDSGTMALIMLDACGLREDIRRTAWLEQYG